MKKNYQHYRKHFQNCRKPTLKFQPSYEEMLDYLLLLGLGSLPHLVILSGIDIGDFLGASGTAVVDPSLPCYGTSIVEFLGLDLFDDIFGIKAGIEGSWKLRSVVVDYSVPEVPLPAAAWLLLGGIGGLAALRRSKKRA